MSALASTTPAPHSSFSGLALKIRSASESETFDLTQPPSTITTATVAAFSTPFLALPTMIRLTFNVGGGKAARGGFDQGAQRAFTSALREVGYEEDKGGGIDWESAGTFKQQHDTGKNLKTVVVFPRIDRSGKSNFASSDASNDASSSSSSTPQSTTQHVFLDRKSPESMCLFASLPVFQKMLVSKTPSWSSKKSLLLTLDSGKSFVLALAQTLMNGTSLTDDEQDVYDSVSEESLSGKEAAVKKIMGEQVEEGKISKKERQQLVEQVKSKVDLIKTSLDSIPDTAEKKRAAMANNLTKANARLAMLEAHSCTFSNPLKNESHISPLRKEIKTLLAIETAAKGRLMTIKETEQMGKKMDLEVKVETLERNSRDWFEADEDFDERVAASRKTGQGKGSGGGKGAGKGAGAKSRANDNLMKGVGAGASWGSAGGKLGSATGGYRPGAGTVKIGIGAGGGKAVKKAGGKAGEPAGMFGAMMLDSDSDSD